MIAFAALALLHALVIGCFLAAGPAWLERLARNDPDPARAAQNQVLRQAKALLARP